MCRIRTGAGSHVAIISLALFATTLVVRALPHVRDGILIPQAAESPGQVTFNHTSHIDDSAPNCTQCHPTPFRMLSSSTRRRPPISHERMDKGEQCGMCHNGKKAFALDEDCTFCHRDEPSPEASGVARATR